MQLTFPGEVARGGALFEATCAACHGADDYPVKGSRLKDFRRRQYADCDNDPAAHDTPALDALTPDDLQAIYDFVHAFNFQDVGEAVPLEPLQGKDRFCYQAAARDLLGQRGAPSDFRTCGIPDRIAPLVPKQVKAAREPAIGVEGCTISWRRNDDDTARYLVYRQAATHPPRHACDVPEPPIAAIGQPDPALGDRVSYPDPPAGLVPGQPYFYAIVAEDDAGFSVDEDFDGTIDTIEPDNRSGFSGWVPCTPRDLEAPGASSVDVKCKRTNCAPPACPPQFPDCCTTPACVDHALDPDPYWSGEGGAPIVVARPVPGPPGPPCSPIIEVTRPADPGDDTFKVRMKRHIDGDLDASGSPIDASGPDHDLDGTICIGFDPLVDTKTCLKVQGFDKSGNLAPLSNGECLVLAGKNKLPPPKITSFTVLDETTGKVKLRFRSVEPQDIVGFAVYTEDAKKEPPLEPETPGCFEGRFPPDNVAGGNHPDFGFCPPTPAGFVILAATRNLKDYADWYDAGSGESLVYLGARVYELTIHLAGGPDAHLEPDALREGVRIALTAIGWSGAESLFVPFTGVVGELPDEDGLIWPTHRADNPADILDPDGDGTLEPDRLDLTLAIGADATSGFTEVVWTPVPDCSETCDEPFVVFRRRQGAQRWQQLSPLYRCQQTCVGFGTLSFRDRDVEDGLCYQYTVVRLDAVGEFRLAYEAASVLYPAGVPCDVETPP